MRTDTLSDMIGQKVLDSRDIISRLEELESEQETNLETVKEHKTRIAEIQSDHSGALPEMTEEETEELERLQSAIWTHADGTEYAESNDWDEEIADEYIALKAIDEECSGYSRDWRHGETLILDSHFEDYAQELAEDCGMVEKTDTWPNRCIDWEQAADELKQDYSSFELQGKTYWMRSC